MKNKTDFDEQTFLHKIVLSIVNANEKQIDGICEMIRLYAARFNADVSKLLELVREKFAEIIQCSTQETFANFIIETASQYNNLEYGLITSKSRKREIVICRQMAVYYLDKETKLTLYAIAEKIGYKKDDHASVLHCIKTVNNNLDIKDALTVRFDKYMEEEINSILSD